MALQPANLDGGAGLERTVDRAADRLEHADAVVGGSPPLRLARRLPLLGPQVATVRDVTRSGARLGGAARSAASAVQVQLDRGTGGAANRVGLLQVVDEQVAAVGRAVADTPRPEGRRGTLPPLDAVRRRVVARLDDTQRRLDDAAVQVGAARRLLVGPRRYLVLAGNNAEMRATGMVLSAGVADLRDGDVQLGGFRQTAELHLGEDRVPVPPELRELYGWLGIGREWRAGTATPSFPSAAPLYAAMSERTELGPVDGVVFVDVIALQAVLHITGPVELDGTTYTEANVADELLYRNYLRFGASDAGTRSERADLQGRLGVAVFQALNSRPLRLGDVADAVRFATRGRHLMGWSRDPAEQRLWRSLGAEGALAPDAIFLNLQNISANKLDYHLRPDLAIRTLSVRRGRRTVELSVTVANGRRDPTSDVVEGLLYGKDHAIPPGGHRSYLLLYLPETASAITAPAGLPFSQSGRDGPNKVVALQYLVEPGQERQVSIRFTLPEAQQVRLLPGGRAHPVRVFTEDGVQDDSETRRIPL